MKGNRTYLTLAAVAAYAVAVKLGLVELDPAILTGAAAAAAAFMRMGIDNAKKAVEFKVAEVSEVMSRPQRPPMPPSGTYQDPNIKSPYGPEGPPSDSGYGAKAKTVVASLLIAVALGGTACASFRDNPDGTPSVKVETIVEVLADFRDVAVTELGFVYDDYPAEFAEAVNKFINTAEEMEDNDGNIADPTFVRVALKNAIPDDLSEDGRRTAERVITVVVVGYRIAYNDALELQPSNGARLVLEEFVNILKDVKADKGF